MSNHRGTVLSEQPISRGDETARDPLPPLGSKERTGHQQVGEALLTDDGRVTDTPQAKTIAIEALAQRMRSSTHALVLASMGLVVGNDMAAHLGSDRYVLVPHNEQYSSMGADVLHLDELDAADPRHTPGRAVRMDTEQADTLVRMIAVNELMSSWAYGSNNNVRVLALQQAAEEEFGLTGVLGWQMDAKTRFAVGLELDYNRDALRDFLRAQYEMTQEVLSARGVTEVLGYRAMSWPEGAEQPVWAAADNVGANVEARQRPLSSWSADRRVVADWLEQRRGNGVILAARQPARDILSLPTTGMGYLGQKEWVALPGEHRATLDGVVSHITPAAAAEQTAAAAVSLGAPVLAEADTAETQAAVPAQTDGETGHGRRPLPIAQDLDPADAFGSRIERILDGEEAAPPWWPQDDSGYAIARRDLDFLGIGPVQIKWLLTGEAPMGMTPELYQQFGSEMLAALQRDGIDESQADLRLKGTSAGFFSGLHKTLPREEDLVGNPTAVQRLREWFGDDQRRPLRRPYDAMWRLGLEPEPSDFDLDINSTAIVRAAREHWRIHHTDRYPGDFMGGHGYLDKQTVLGTLPALADWANRWQAKLGRPLSLGVFESAGPFDATRLGRALSSHFKDTDWIIHRPDTPRAWRIPQSRMTDPTQPPARNQPSIVAARSKSTTSRRQPGQDRAVVEALSEVSESATAHGTSAKGPSAVVDPSAESRGSEQPTPAVHKEDRLDWRASPVAPPADGSENAQFAPASHGEARPDESQAVDPLMERQDDAPPPIDVRKETQPYESRGAATRASREVAGSFQSWIETSMGRELAQSSIPKVIAFRDAWQGLPSADLPDGPGRAAGQYREVAERARDLAEAAVAAGRFDRVHIMALRALSAEAGTHASRRAVTLPGTPGGVQPHPAAVATPSVAPQAVAQSRPQIAAPAPPPARGPRAGM